jgi:hypothetical protein
MIKNKNNMKISEKQTSNNKNIRVDFGNLIEEK